MKIGLVDVDGHNFPNLALMKISAWHKKHGDIVHWAGSLERYDIVYMAKVFFPLRRMISKRIKLTKSLKVELVTT